MTHRADSKHSTVTDVYTDAAARSILHPPSPHMKTSLACPAAIVGVTYSAYPVAHGNLLVSFRMRMGRAIWSAEHSISSRDNPRNSGLIYGNFIGSSEPGLPPPPELPPAMIPPMNPATADLTRVSMLAVRRGGTSVGRCAAPRLPFPGFPPSSAALVDDSLDGEREETKAEEEEEESRQTVKVSFSQSGGSSRGRRAEVIKRATMLQIKPSTAPLITARPS